MTDRYESMILGGSSRNVEYLGAFVAWLLSNGMLSAEIEHSAGRAIARVRMQDMTGSAFLTTVLHGELTPHQLNDVGRAFSDSYFVSGRYQADYDRCEFRGDSDWRFYDEVSPYITAAFQAHVKAPSRLNALTAKILKFPGRKR